MITTRRIEHSGAWECSAMVRQGGMAWIEWNVFYGYTKKDAVKLFREYVKEKGYKLCP